MLCAPRRSAQTQSAAATDQGKLGLALALLTVSLASGALSACTKKPSQDQCNALADHMHRLLTKANVKNSEKSKVMMEKERDRFVMVCVREGSHAVVQCMLDAQSWDGLIASCGDLVR